jgi:predicted metal-binding membrane protein
MQMLATMRRMSAPHWVGLYLCVFAAWGGLYLMQVPPELRELGELYGAEFWREFCSIEAGWAGAPTIFGMWLLMSAAMMAPTAIPAFVTWEDLTVSGAARGFGAITLGYLGVWAGFSAIATVFQVILSEWQVIDTLGRSQNDVLTAGLLAGAGAYQFSALKEACLSKCRKPLTFFMQHWDEGPLRMGVRLGAVCLGCCWALMALAFVGGTMNLLWMGGAMVLMFFEKMPDIGQHLTRPVGAALIGAAGWVLFF